MQDWAIQLDRFTEAVQLPVDLGACKFIQTLYEMVTCETNKHVIGFSEDGMAIEIRSVPDLQWALSRYYAHPNTPTFIRRLNSYGFRVVRMNVFANGNTVHVFAHPYFRRGELALLQLIRSNKTAAKSGTKRRLSVPQQE